MLIYMGMIIDPVNIVLLRRLLFPYLIDFLLSMYIIIIIHYEYSGM